MEWTKPRLNSINVRSRTEAAEAAFIKRCERMMNAFRPHENVGVADAAQRERWSRLVLDRFLARKRSAASATHGRQQMNIRGAPDVGPMRIDRARAGTTKRRSSAAFQLCRILAIFRATRKTYEYLTDRFCFVARAE